MEGDDGVPHHEELNAGDKRDLLIIGEKVVVFSVKIEDFFHAAPPVDDRVGARTAPDLHKLFSHGRVFRKGVDV